MTNTSTLRLTRTFTFELHEFLRAIDGASWRDEVVEALSARLVAVEGHCKALMDAAEWAEREHAWARARVEEIAAVVERYTPSRDLPRRAARRQWRQLRKRLVPAYESLARALRERSIEVPSIRPINAARIATHLTGMSVILAFLLFDAPLMAKIATTAGFAAFTWTCELLRRRSERINDLLMAFFRPIAHPQERYRVNSSTWYATAILILSFFDVPMVSAAAVIALGLGDTAAGLAGRKLGRIRLMEHRTLEGSIAFVLVTVFGVTTYTSLVYPEVGWAATLTLAAAAAIAGAAAEALSKKLDDNFTVPLASAAAAAAVALLFGVPL